MPYNPRTGINVQSLEDLKTWVEEEFDNISSEFAETTVLELRTIDVEPVKPREGMIVHADGTNWNPGSGEGGYIYSNGGWVALNAQDLSTFITTTAAIAAFLAKSANLSDVASPSVSRGNLGLSTAMLQLLHVEDQKASGTVGGTGTAATWTKRTINTVVTNEITGASLASSQITLAAGVYFIDARAPAFYCNNHRIRLQNITDTATTLLGTSEYSATGGAQGFQTESRIRGRFTIAGTKVFEIQHNITLSGSVNDFGVPASMGVEIYTQALIWKVG